MANRIALGDHLSIDRGELNFTFSRSPGPGGQNVNKVNTKATVHWAFWASDDIPWQVKNRLATLYAKRINDSGELVLSSSRHRSQPQNIDDCIDKLRSMVMSAASPPKPRRPTRPPRSVKINRVKAKRENSAKKQSRKPPSTDEY